MRLLLQTKKDVGWDLDMDSACDAFSFSMDTMLALFCCLFVYLNVALQLPPVYL